MDIKGVTLEEAVAMNTFLSTISYGAPGTMDKQHEALSRLISFRAKVRQAIKEEARSDTTGLAPSV